MTSNHDGLIERARAHADDMQFPTDCQFTAAETKAAQLLHDLADALASLTENGEGERNAVLEEAAKVIDQYVIDEQPSDVKTILARRMASSIRNRKSASPAIATTPVADVPSGTRRRQFKLWFFRDLSEDQRKLLYTLAGLPSEEIHNHMHEAMALDHILATLTASPSSPQVMDTGGWQPIETHPTGDELFLAYCPPDQFPDGRMIIVRGSILTSMRSQKTPDHLQFPATHWRHLPAAPIQGEKPETEA